MKIKTIITSVLITSMCFSCGNSKQNSQSIEPSLKDVTSGHFLIGTALNDNQVDGLDSLSVGIVNRHFNSIVAENCMKSEVIHPEEDIYNFGPADAFVAFGEANGMNIIGHCLIWHSQLSPWFCVDKQGNNVSPEVLKQRMKDHITTIVKRYKGRIDGWDVVNEAINDDGTYRNTKFYEILGEEYIPLAFQYAHEADPDAELYYNDYGMHLKGRRDGVVKLINDLKVRGIKVDAIGMQGHMGMDYPDIKDFEQSMEEFAATGTNLMITEWDMSALPTVNTGANISDTTEYQQQLNPYPNGLPDSIAIAWNQRMLDFWNLFMKHSDKVTRVTLWGVTDQDSWKNDWPVAGRTEYPLMFDRDGNAKPFVVEILQTNNQ